ncbi:MAG: hypothetical protein ACOYL5_05640, partial [Phototrophicaceae bacterium]
MRQYAAFAVVALILSTTVVYGFVRQPTYTDAFYYINAANRLVSGQGLTDEYLWIYIGMPPQLPAPSHIYWMPMASLIAAAGMWLFNAPTVFWAAQAPFVLLLTLTGINAFWLGKRFSGTFAHAWAAGLITVGGGFFSRYWGMPETFTPYALFGSSCLIALSRGVETRRWPWMILAGVCAAAAHLTRADGILFILAGLAAFGWMKLFARRENRWGWGEAVRAVLVLIIAYLLAMAPWFARNLTLIGTPLPTGGTQGIWYTEYNDIFAYPPDATPQTLFAEGWGLFLESRRVGFNNGLATLIVIEGMIVLFPFMLLALWRRRRESFLLPFWIYALGLHLAMTLVFPFPGYRGGLFHSAAALLPYWVALGVVGLDDAVTWLAKRRRWNPTQARGVFRVATVIITLTLSAYIGGQHRAVTPVSAIYPALEDLLPDGA